MTSGHRAFAGREADGPVEVADGPVEVRKAVREQFAAGAGCIKLIATGRVRTRA